METINLDVVVPSARPNVGKLNSIANLKVPNGIKVHFIFVIDKPDFSQVALETYFQSKELTIIRNGSNLGAHISRNKGFDAGSGEYVLFLDDDVEPPENLLETYSLAIKRDPNSPGFIGPVKFPSCINSHTKAAVASDILTFWDIARTSPKLAWGITANLMVKRAVVGEIRFSDTFPKNGGGEDVDFCLRIVEKCGSWFTTVPNAEIFHPWWGHGKQQYKRFARWAYGDSILPILHPKYKFRNAPNLIESTLLLSLFALLGFVLFKISIEWFFVWLMTAFFLELFMDGLRMKLAGKKQTLIVSILATAIRLSNDLGRIAGHIKNGHLGGFAERFDYFMTGEHIRYERKIACAKFFVYITMATTIFIILK